MTCRRRIVASRITSDRRQDRRVGGLMLACLAGALIGGGCESNVQPSGPPPAAEAEQKPKSEAEQELERLASADADTRRGAARRLGRLNPQGSTAAYALAKMAVGDPVEAVREEAVRALKEMGTGPSAASLEQVVLDGRVEDRAWKSAAAALAGERAPDEAARVFQRKAARSPGAVAVLSAVLQRVEPTRKVKDLLLEWTRGDDVEGAKLAAECLFYYLNRAEETFEPAVRNVLPRLERHGTKLSFARAAVGTETQEAATAVAAVAAESDNPDDWRVAVEVFRTKVLPEHRESFAHFRAIAIKNKKWRFQIEVRKLIREHYADDLILTVGGRTFTFDAVWTREDLLDWQMVQRKAKRDSAIVWLSPESRSREIPVVETPKDYLLVNGAGRVVTTHTQFMRQGVMTGEDVMYIVVLPAETAEQLAIQPGAAVEFDRELTHALSEMEMQDLPPGRGI